MKKLVLVTILISLISLNSVFAQASSDNLAPGLQFKDNYTIVGDKNLYTDFEPLNPDNTVNAIIEIPTGTNAKWEVGKDGIMTWELRDGKPRIVQYLGYVGNYGMIPRTIGGDNDSLDILVLGQPELRGAWVNAKVIGALKLVDKNEQDDKLIAVIPGSDMGKVNTIAELDEKFPGVTNIIETWFTNYKGKGKMKSEGFVEAEQAREILLNASNTYNNNKK